MRSRAGKTNSFAGTEIAFLTRTRAMAIQLAQMGLTNYPTTVVSDLSPSLATTLSPVSLFVVPTISDVREG